MVGRQRRERELDSAADADRLLDHVEQRRRGWLLVALGVLVLALALGVPWVLSPGSDSDAVATTRPGDDVAVQAGAYAAALSGGPRPHRLAQRVYVNARECGDVASMPTSACTGRPIAPAVQARVRAVLGTQVVFRENPGAPATNGGVPVTGFGPLRVHHALGRYTAHLPMETMCGTSCGQGQTLVLRWHDRVWQVSGSTGPQWLS